MLPELVDQALADAGCTLADVARVGIGFGGPVNTRRGVVLKSFQVVGWDGFPLRDWAGQQWGKPVSLQNDAGAAALAEARHGAGRGCDRVFYVTIGSGIGGGWVAQGRLDEGQGLGAAEIGHWWLPHPVGGEPAELEQLCSGWAIGRRAREAAQREPSRMAALAGSVAAIDARTVYAAAEQGDAVAQRLLQETYRSLGLALANVVALLHPQRIVIGGGVSLMGPLFWEPLRAEVRRGSLPLLAESVAVLPAALGEAVVVIGALCLEPSG
jgi:glucokinase